MKDKERGRGIGRERERERKREWERKNCSFVSCPFQNFLTVNI